jgi:hypothetical protein
MQDVGGFISPFDEHKTKDKGRISVKERNFLEMFTA